MSQDKRITEIQEQAAGLTRKFKTLLETKSLTDERYKVTLTAYGGLLFWRRTELELMVKEFENDEDWIDKY